MRRSILTIVIAAFVFAGAVDTASAIRTKIRTFATVCVDFTEDFLIWKARADFYTSSTIISLNPNHRSARFDHYHRGSEHFNRTCRYYGYTRREKWKALQGTPFNCQWPFENVRLPGLLRDGNGVNEAGQLRSFATGGHAQRRQRPDQSQWDMSAKNIVRLSPMDFDQARREVREQFSELGVCAAYWVRKGTDGTDGSTMRTPRANP